MKRLWRRCHLDFKTTIVGLIMLQVLVWDISKQLVLQREKLVTILSTLFPKVCLPQSVRLARKTTFTWCFLPGKKTTLTILFCLVRKQHHITFLPGKNTTLTLQNRSILNYNTLLIRKHNENLRLGRKSVSFEDLARSVGSPAISRERGCMEADILTNHWHKWGQWLGPQVVCTISYYFGSVGCNALY